MVLSPFELVYGKFSIFLIEFEVNTLRTIVEVGMDLTTTHKCRLE